jgi:sugar lactone lactonase YvrE
MENKFYIFSIFLIVNILAASSTVAEKKIYWPPPPDDARIEYIGEISLNELKTGTGFFAKLKQFVTGSSDKDKLSLPYDVLFVDDIMFLTCQGIPFLIEVDLKKKSYKKHFNEDDPFSFPICLSNGGNEIIFITDSENKAVYKYQNGKVSSFIASGLSRPTGITAMPELQKIFVIDTGEHCMKIYNYDGKLLDVISQDKLKEEQFHFPTFVTSTSDGYILVNDALNYKIKRFDSEGNFMSSFGAEGDSPGTFARPKGIATDSERNIYVIDNLFDNLQILNTEGRALLVIGSAGQEKGQFWSPSGIAISRDTVYIADTFNNRIQILHFIGGSDED